MCIEKSACVPRERWIARDLATPRPCYFYIFTFFRFVFFYDSACIHDETATSSSSPGTGPWPPQRRRRHRRDEVPLKNLEKKQQNNNWDAAKENTRPTKPLERQCFSQRITSWFTGCQRAYYRRVSRLYIWPLSRRIQLSLYCSSITSVEALFFQCRNVFYTRADVFQSYFLKCVLFSSDFGTVAQYHGNN